MALNDIMQSIKDFFTRLTRRQKALPEPQIKSNPQRKTAYATNNPSDWKRSLSVDFQPQKHNVLTEVTEKHMLSGSRHQRKNAQENAQNPYFRKKVAALAVAGALILGSGVAKASGINPFQPNSSNPATEQSLFKHSYKNDTTEELISVLSNNHNLSDSQLNDIRIELGNRGLNTLKVRIADALDIDYQNKPELLNSMITVYAAEDGTPAKVKTPSGTYYNKVLDEDRSNTISDGIAAFINDTAKVMEGTVSQSQLANFAKQNALLDPSNKEELPSEYYSFETTPNEISGKRITPAGKGIDDLLCHYSITNNIKEIDEER